nr:MAG TPA: hypothetical protein [Caudoviricetes sp.]
MKLIDLLSVIPDECRIGIARPEDQRHGVIGDKYDAITRFAYRNKLIKEQVENMDVSRVYPCANAQCAEELLLEDDIPSLYVVPAVIIEIE